jgi:hypothetical protein
MADFKFPTRETLEQIKGGSSEVQIEHTYLSDTMRVSRNSDGQVFVYTKEPSTTGTLQPVPQTQSLLCYTSPIPKTPNPRHLAQHPTHPKARALTSQRLRRSGGGRVGLWRV